MLLHCTVLCACVRVCMCACAVSTVLSALCRHAHHCIACSPASLVHIHAGARQYYVLSLHRDTPLDQQAAASAASAAQAPAQSAAAAGLDDGFAGFTLKGGKVGGARKEPVVPQQGCIAGAAYLLHKVHCTCTLCDLPTHSLTHSLTHPPPTNSPTHSLTHSLTLSLTHSLTHCNCYRHSLLL